MKARRGESEGRDVRLGTPRATHGAATHAKGETHPAFTLVLAGGGARGFAHVGVLRALTSGGLRPSALVGVSMGAVVAATYALNPNWYEALLSANTASLPGPRLSTSSTDGSGPLRGLRRTGRVAETLWRMTRGWGVPPDRVAPSLRLLRSLTRGRGLRGGLVPVAVCATDLRTGKRVVLSAGNAAESVYASSALAGVLPPLEKDDRLLVDGAYADLAPIDVARAFGHPLVIAVDPGQQQFDGPLQNGLQALVRALEICHTHHAQLRFAQADLVLRPAFRGTVDLLEFEARRECVAAGIRTVRQHRHRLRGLMAHLEDRSEDAQRKKSRPSP
ncbi:MAG: patatin-like phospholipase family protein [Gemmatimonadota bacterium]